MRTVTLLTTSSARELSWLHDREPVILSPRDARLWLDPTRSFESLCAPGAGLERPLFEPLGAGLAWHFCDPVMNAPAYAGGPEACAPYEPMRGARTITSFFRARGAGAAASPAAGAAAGAAVGAGAVGAGAVGAGAVGAGAAGAGAAVAGTAVAGAAVAKAAGTAGAAAVRAAAGFAASTAGGAASAPKRARLPAEVVDLTEEGGACDAGGGAVGGAGSGVVAVAVGGAVGGAASEKAEDAAAKRPRE